jgi:Tol biopolymer transport system component
MMGTKPIRLALLITRDNTRVCFIKKEHCMAVISKRIIPLLTIILFISACGLASPTAQATLPIISTAVPTVSQPAEIVTEQPTEAPTEVVPPTQTQAPSEAVPGIVGTMVFGSDRGNGYSNIYLLNSSDGSVVQLTNNESNTFPGPFSPDGKKLLFTGYGLTNSYVGLMNSDGSNPVDLSARSDVDEGFATWSPDGKQIAFTSRMDGNNEIYIMDVNGMNVKRVTNNPADDFAPAWSPDGKTIAFVSDRNNATGVNNLYLMNIDGSNVVRLTQGDEIDYSPAWSPDGKQIAFRADVDGNSDIYLINADGNGRVNLTNDPASDWSPAWSPDGRMIAFQTDRDGNWEIYVMNADGTNPINLTDNPADDQMPYWKPVATGTE